MRYVLALLLLTACSLSRTVPTPKHTPEPTGWSLCYEADGTVADYDGNCDKPTLLKWQLPVRVYIDPTYPHPTSVKQAISAWNEWLDSEFLKVTDTLDGAGVHVIDGGPPSFAAGMALHQKINGGVLFHLYMFDNYEDRTDIIAHELGHVLGLAHDPGYKRSIMYPAGDWYLTSVTKNDCRYLGRLYDRHLECE